MNACKRADVLVKLPKGLRALGKSLGGYKELGNVNRKVKLAILHKIDLYRSCSTCCSNLKNYDVSKSFDRKLKP